MLDKAHSDTIYYLKLISDEAYRLRSEIQSLRFDLQQEASRAEFRFYFWFCWFIIILFTVACAKLR